MSAREDSEPANWIDPDIIVYYEERGDIASYDLSREHEFKEFFEKGWLNPAYDDLRPKWDPLLKDEDPYGRVFAKTALWSVVKLREARQKIQEAHAKRDAQSDEHRLK